METDFKKLSPVTMGFLIFFSLLAALAVFRSSTKLPMSKSPKMVAEHPRKWTLENVEEMHRFHPDTFEIAPLDERKGLDIGRTVRLIFRLKTIQNGKPTIVGERMFVKITEKTSDGYVGTLENYPVTPDILSPGDLIRFQYKHIATVMIPVTDPRHPDYKKNN